MSRSLENVHELAAWAASQGFVSMLPDPHVTLLFSRAPVNWDAVDPDSERVMIYDAGSRQVEQFHNVMTATVLQFSSTLFQKRHAQLEALGGSHDFDHYFPHITITYHAPDGLDLSKVQPFAGPLCFGPEQLRELDLAKTFNPPMEGGL